MKIKVLFSALLIALALIFAGCGKDNSTTPAANNNNNNNNNLTIPQPPSNIYVIPQDTKIFVSWDMDTTLTYTIYYQQGATVTKANAFKLPPNATTKITSPTYVVDLLANTDYTFALTAKNAKGESDLSTTYTVKLGYSSTGNWVGYSNDTTSQANYYKIKLALVQNGATISGSGTVYYYSGGNLTSKPISIVTGTYQNNTLAIFFNPSDVVVSFTGVTGVSTSSVSGLLIVPSKQIAFTFTKTS